LCNLALMELPDKRRNEAVAALAGLAGTSVPD
jgi:hypothetical protein